MGQQLGDLRLGIPKCSHQWHNDHPDFQYSSGRKHPRDRKVSEITPNAYEFWSAQYPGADPAPGLDSDRGGLPTGIDGGVGGNPTLGDDDAAFAPVFDNTTDPNGKFRFTNRRSDAAGQDPKTTIAVEYGSALTIWTTATHQGTGAIPRTLASGGRLFARLEVLVTKP